MQGRRSVQSHPSFHAAARPADLAAGDRFDRYVVQRLLARGGGADVYAATHAYTHAPVALKIPREDTSVARARFEREIEALARVRGPGIVEMLDAGQSQSRPFIAFRALDGRTLGGLLTARGQLTVADALAVGWQVSAALERCHAAGVIHRDVKPSNLFVGPGPEAQLTLLDFGIAKLADLPETAVKLTREHSLLGTPEYMAPEALLSSSQVVDGRTDVYGLGVTLYECLTGVVPFEGGYVNVLLEQSMRPPTPVAQRRPDLPPALGAVIDRCLSPAADDRFESISALHAALTACAPTKNHTIDLFGRAAAAPEADQAQTLADTPSAKAGVNPAGVRRKHPRAPYVSLARITLASGERVDGRVEEISEGGLQFVGDFGVPEQQAVKIRFALPVTGRVAEVAAVSRWNRTVRGCNATGFELTEIADPHRAEIRQYVSIMCPEDSCAAE